MNLLRTASTVSLLTLASRITGMVREALGAAAFGATGWGDAYQVAFRIPNLLRRLFAEGAFSQAFVPIIADTRTREGDDVTHRLVNAVATILFWALLVTCAVGIVGGHSEHLAAIRRSCRDAGLVESVGDRRRLAAGAAVQALGHRAGLCARHWRDAGRIPSVGRPGAGPDAHRLPAAHRAQHGGAQGRLDAPGSSSGAAPDAAGTDRRLGGPAVDDDQHPNRNPGRRGRRLLVDLGRSPDGVPD